MGRKYVLLDDYDGKELADDTQPVRLSLGRTTYSMYLSEDNHGRLLEVLKPFIETADTDKPAQAPKGSSNSSSADKEKMKKVREWAQSTGFKFKDAQGNEKVLGDRGRIPDEVVKAYEEAN